MGALPSFMPLMQAQNVRHLYRPIRDDELITKSRPEFEYETSPKPCPVIVPKEEVVAPPPKPRDVIDLLSIQHVIIPAWKWIVIEVCKKHGVPMDDICSHRRDKKTSEARAEACYRLRNETAMSLEQIGKRLGGKDHTSIRYAVEAHGRRLAEME